MHQPSAGRQVLAALSTGMYIVVTLVIPFARRRLPLALAGASTLRVRYPDGARHLAPGC